MSASASDFSACPLGPQPGHRAALVLLFVIAAVGLFVRLHGLSGESVWFDEFTSLVFLSPPESYTESPHFERWQQYTFHKESPSLSAFLVDNRSIDPATMPGYDALEYLWNQYVGSSVLSMRLLSILIGMLIIPAIFVLGRMLYGNTAGLVAALCVALSPIHRHFAQEIHMYGMVSLLAVVSAWSFVHVVREGRLRWWVLHIAANTLLVWTHTFAALVPMVEGGFLVLFHFKAIKRNAVWIALHVAIAVPLMVFMTTIQFWSSDLTASWMRVPTFNEFAGDLLADDAIGHTYQMRATPNLWSVIVSPERAEAVVNQCYAVGKVMKWLFVTASATLVAWSLWRALRAKRRGEQADSDWRWSLFLVLWWLFPAVFLYAVSVLVRPMIFPRYTTHSSLALYVILGGAVAALPRRWLRAVAVGVLLLLYGYQTSLVLVGPQRTDWQSAAGLIRAEAQPQDLVLVQDWMWKRVFIYNMGPMDNVLSYAKDLSTLAEMCAFYLDPALPLDPPSAEPRRVFAAIRTDYFAGGPSYGFEGELTQRRLSFQLTEFGGIQHVLVYEVTRNPDSIGAVALPKHLGEDAPKEFCDLAMEFWRVKQHDVAVKAARRVIDMAPNYSRAFTYIGMALKEKGDADGAIEAFRKAVELDPHDYLWSHVNLSTLLADKERFAEAEAAVRKALEIDPNYSWAYTCLAKSLIGQGRTDEARQALEKAIQLDPGDPRPRDALTALSNPPLAQAPSPAPAAPGLDEVKTLLDQEQADEALARLRDIRKSHPGDAAVFFLTGRALLGKGDDTGALMSLRKAFELDPALAQSHGELVRTLLERHDVDGARREAERLKGEGREVPPEFQKRLEGTP